MQKWCQLRPLRVIGGGGGGCVVLWSAPTASAGTKASNKWKGIIVQLL